MDPEFSEGGIVGQTRAANDYRFSNSLHNGGRVKMLLKSSKLWSSESPTIKTLRLWFAVLPQKHAVSTKSDQRQILHMFSLLVDRFNAVQQFNLVLFKDLHSLRSLNEFRSRERASFPVLITVTCSPSCIVTALGVSRVRGAFVNKKRNPQFLQGFLEFKLAWLSSTETVVCEQLTSTKCHIRIIWDNTFTFNFPTVVVKHLILNLKPIQITLESAIKQFLIANWELRNFLLTEYAKWQNRLDKASLRLFYTSFFGIPKKLACHSEAMKLFSDSFFVWLLMVSLKPIKTEHRRSCLESATNVLVWSSEYQQQRNCPNSWLLGRAPHGGTGAWASTLGWKQFGWFQKHFDPSAIMQSIGKPIVICGSCLANNTAFSEFRMHHDWLNISYLWEKIGSFSTHRLFFLLWRKNVYIKCGRSLLPQPNSLGNLLNNPKDDSKIPLLNYKTFVANVFLS